MASIKIDVYVCIVESVFCFYFFATQPYFLSVAVHPASCGLRSTCRETSPHRNSRQYRAC